MKATRETKTLSLGLVFKSFLSQQKLRSNIGRTSSVICKDAKTRNLLLSTVVFLGAFYSNNIIPPLCLRGIRMCAAYFKGNPMRTSIKVQHNRL